MEYFRYVSIIIMPETYNTGFFHANLRDNAYVMYPNDIKLKN